MTDSRQANYVRALEFAERQVARADRNAPRLLPDLHRRRQVASRRASCGPIGPTGFSAGMMWQFHLPHRRRRSGASRPSTTRSCSSIGSTTATCTTWASSSSARICPGIELTGDEQLHDVLIQAGRTLAMRFKEKGQYLRSFVATESLFIDIMMNVPIIFYAASETGDRELARIATAHCRTTRDTIVRPDGSTAHEGIFDLADGRVPAADDAPGPRGRTAPGPAAWPGRCTATASATR